MCYGDRIAMKRAESVPGRLIAAVFCAVLAAVAGLGPAAAAGAQQQLTYKVTHSLFGEVGTYTNTIEPAGNDVKVETAAHLKVTVLGATLYSEDAQRTEVWQGNRLVAFHGRTSKDNNPPIEVNGTARDGHFVIYAPSGIETAPASIHPANPWSANFIGTQAMMRPDTGKVEQVHVLGGYQSTVTIDGVDVPARKYNIVGSTRYSVWLDEHNLPIQFRADDDSGRVTFTLTRCVRCGFNLADAKSR
jgi:uncharacterized protein DUF6134